MTNRAFSSLSNRLSVSATGAPPPVLEDYIRRSAIKVCERTHYWRVMLPPMTLIPGVWTYKFAGMPVGSEVFTLMGATLNGRKIDILPPEVLACCFPQWDNTSVTQVEEGIAFADAIYNVPPFDDDTLYNSVASTFTHIVERGSEPQAIGRLSPCEFVVLPKPDGDKEYKLQCYVALRPTREATGMDACVFDDLEEVIEHGALQDLLVLPGAHWTNPELAAYHARQYLFKLTERRARANLGFSRGALVAHPQPFGV